MKKALITGITGQDGSYLAEHLLSLGYEVHGTTRRNSTPEHQETRVEGLDIKTYYSDLTDFGSIERIMNQVQPDEIYNLAAQSHVRISFEIPQYTAQVNALGVLNILEAFRRVCPWAKFYQASSSEMFGNSIDPDGFQRETTAMHPVSPYGCAKLYAYSIVKNYRKAYGLFAANGILFNHESPRRGSNFVTLKIIKEAVKIKRRQSERLDLGNLESSRDWGHSKDYVRAMQLILAHSEPDDFVISTGETNSVKRLVQYVFGQLGLDWRDWVYIDEKHKRPEELEVLKGDSSKARALLGWEPEFDFKKLIDEMLSYELRRNNK